MNFQMLKTELHKIYSKKVIWIAMTLFLILFLFLKLQIKDNIGVKYTLEPVKTEITETLNNEEFHTILKENDYNLSTDEMFSYISKEVLEYINQYKGKKRIYSSLISDLRTSIISYYKKIDEKEKFISDLEKKIPLSSGNEKKAMEKSLEEYKNSNAKIEVNLESSADNFIDINHSMVFPSLIMLIVILGISGIYADEYTNNTESILLTTKKGRVGVFISKLLASVIYITSVVIIMETFFIVTTSICYHGSNFKISTASTYGLYLTNYSGNVGSFVIRQILSTLLAGFTLGSIVMAISSRSKNALIPFFITGIFYGSTALFANIINFPPFISKLWSLPGELSLFMLQTQYKLIEVSHYTSVFGILIPTVFANIIFNICLAIIFLFICYKGYVKKEVTN